MCSLNYRQYYGNGDDVKQPYQLALEGLFFSSIAFVLSLNIKDLLPFISFSNHFRNLLTGLSFFSVVGCLVVLVICNLFREKVPILKLKRMGFKARFVAWRIRRLFNVKTVIDVLKFDSQTRYGLMLPEIEVFVNSTCSEGFVAIENLQNISKLSNSKTIQDLSGLLVGWKLQQFSFVSSELSKDGNFYLFYFEDTASSQRFTINTDADLARYISSNKHDLKLDKTLIWHTSKDAHLSLIGRTRSGKSVFLSDYLLPLMKLQDWEVHYYSVKPDIYVKKYDGESDPVKIVEALEYWVTVTQDRLKKIADAGRSKYTEVNLNDVAVVLDEVSNFNGMLEGKNKEQKALKERANNAIASLTSRSASAGIHFIGASQYGSKDAFVESRSKTNMQDAVIILGLAADSADDRKYLMPGFEIPERVYKSGQGVARFVNSGRRWEQPHYFETPLISKYVKK